MKRKLSNKGFVLAQALILTVIASGLGSILFRETHSQFNESSAAVRQKLDTIMQSSDSENDGTTGDLGGLGGSTITMPVKGDLIIIEDKEYRVLKTDGTEAFVLAMFDAASTTFNDSDSYLSASFNGTDGQKYEGSNLDTYMNDTWYNAQSVELKNAIVPKTIVQNMYGRTETAPKTGDYWSAWYKSSFTATTESGTVYYITNRNRFTIVGERNVYVLDVADVSEYLGDNWSPQELNMMFFNRNSAISKYIWLRSANSGTLEYAWYVHGGYGRLSGGGYHYNNYSARPAFVINLSLVDWSPAD